MAMKIILKYNKEKKYILMHNEIYEAAVFIHTDIRPQIQTYRFFTRRSFSVCTEIN